MHETGYETSRLELTKPYTYIIIIIIIIIFICSDKNR